MYLANTRLEIIQGQVADLVFDVGEIHGAVTLNPRLRTLARQERKEQTQQGMTVSKEVKIEQRKRAGIAKSFVKGQEDVEVAPIPDRAGKSGIGPTASRDAPEHIRLQSAKYQGIVLILGRKRMACKYYAWY